MSSSLEDIKFTLKKIGLAGNEGKVYLSLLRLGSAKAGRISKEAGINRTTTYDSLKRLLDRGMISYVVKENRKWFQTIDPRRLLELIKEQEEEAKKILPDLLRMYKAPTEKQNVTLFYGQKGLKTVFMDILREGQPNLVLDSQGPFVEKMPYFWKFFVKELNRKKIKIKHLVDPSVNVNPSKYTEVRHLLNKMGGTSVINIYADKIAILIWSEPPEAVIIKNKAAADTFRNYFNLLWEIAKK